MNLEDARDFKMELWNTIGRSARGGTLERLASRVAFANKGRPRLPTGTSFAASLAGRDDNPAPNFSIALGIAMKPNGDYGAAIRVQASRGNHATANRIRTVLPDSSDIDFRVIGKVRASKAWYRDIARPLRIGPSVGHVDITAGTIGGFVSISGLSGTYMLSNNHVLANVDKALPGDHVLQPGPIDNPAPDQLIGGTFERAVRLSNQDVNEVDCAIASIHPSNSIEPAELWNVGKLSGAAEPFGTESDFVFKIGRTTGLTWGRVTAIELDPIEIDMGDTIMAFDQQIEVEGTGAGPFSKGGDSGSLVIDTNRNAIGLLFAGSTAGGSNGKGLTFVNPIGTVLDQLNAKLVT